MDSVSIIAGALSGSLHDLIIVCAACLGFAVAYWLVRKAWYLIQTLTGMNGV